MRARKVIASKTAFSDGTILELVVWEVPKPVPGSSHLYKYRLFFGRIGQRVVGFDNERGKGDHRHRLAIETPYQFADLETLIGDFLREVEQWRSEHDNADNQG